jgi:hypothetical protein
MGGVAATRSRRRETSPRWTVDELEKRHRLRRIKLIALALLPLMVILLVVSGRLKSTYPEFAAVQFFAEASLIGGLADWFAASRCSGIR